MSSEKMETATNPSTVISGPVGRTIFLLALPVLGEQILNTFVGLFDTWLAGQFSASATAAVGLAAYVSWLASMIVMLVGTGTTALVSRHKGSGNDVEVNRYANQSMTLAFMVGISVFILLFSAAPTIAHYLRMTGEAHAITVNYLRIDAVGHLFMALTLVGSAALRGVGDMRTPMFIFAIINTVNVVTSCLFVYTFNMGVTGIVCGTITARILGAVIMVAILIHGRSGLALKRHLLGMAWERARRILRIGLPAAADGAIMWSGHFAFLAVISRVADGPLGEASLAAHIIAVRVEALTYLPAVAWGTATATMIGQSLGANDPDRAKRTGNAAVLQCGVISVVMAMFFFFGATWIYEQMSLDPLVRATGSGPFRIVALLQPTLVVSIVYIWGLRGAGDTRSPMFITMMGVVLRLSAGYYFGIICEGGLAGAWIGMYADMVWRMVAASYRYLGGRWLATTV